MSEATAAEYLTRTSLLRLIAVMALVVAPHVGHLPPWALLLTALVMGWRIAAALRLWPMPPRWLKLGAAVGVFAAIYLSFGRGQGQTAGTALLVVMLALKLTEMRARRDVMVVIALFYFLLLTHFLYSQEIWTVAYLGLCALIITALLVEASHPGMALSPRVSLRQAGIMLVQALPLMAVLFVLFPRIPGPLWGLPRDAGGGRTGLSDSMSPGEISELIKSDEVAFRVRFQDDPPAMPLRYWRGPVFWSFDGRRWRFDARDLRLLSRLPFPPVDYRGDPVRYEVMLEPHGRRWLFALDLPDLQTLPQDARLTYDYQIHAQEQVINRRAYTMRSYPEHRFQPQLPEPLRRLLTELPPRGDARSRALAAQWRAEARSDLEVVRRALRMFREEPFYYTLRPPPLPGDIVDGFLFGTRRGFCEHYAGSFTFLMRAAGIPARVVTGYQGGQLNDLGGYYVVRQSDAHAWSEVWLEGHGWVRADPTAAVAPARIETGIEASMGAEDGLPGFLQQRGWGNLRYALEARWDLVNMYWNEWFLGFGPERQMRLLERLRLGSWERMILAMTVLISLAMTIIGLAVLRRAAPVRRHDEALLLWQRACRRLARVGLPPAPGEGPRDYAARVARERPALAEPVQRLAEHYLQARYLAPEAPEGLAALRSALRRLPR